MKVLEIDKIAKMAYCEITPAMSIWVPQEMLKQYGIAWSKVKVGAELEMPKL